MPAIGDLLWVTAVACLDGLALIPIMKSSDKLLTVKIEMMGRASNVMGGGLYTGVFAVVLHLNRRKQNVLNCGYTSCLGCQPAKTGCVAIKAVVVKLR